MLRVQWLFSYPDNFRWICLFTWMVLWVSNSTICHQIWYGWSLAKLFFFWVTCIWLPGLLFCKCWRMFKSLSDLSIFLQNFLICKPGFYEAEMPFYFVKAPSCNSLMTRPAEVLMPHDTLWFQRCQSQHSLGFSLWHDAPFISAQRCNGQQATADWWLWSDTSHESPCSSIMCFCSAVLLMLYTGMMFVTLSTRPLSL